MKRSTINQIIEEADEFIRSFGFVLPPFANWSPKDFERDTHAHIIERRLGWDITDYGAGRFDTLGLTLFTLRNGSLAELKSGAGQVYAEKIMISRVDQISPMHRHNLKTEDIINRGGGRVVLELFASDADGMPDQHTALDVLRDGVSSRIQAGARIALGPGESITLFPGQWHAFWAEDADALIGEVSTVNDDLSDNVFADDIGRFSEIAEDCAPVRLLVSDYQQFFAA
ncbi:MAG: D-lyxose/D-mannose family sugar isomerase [Paracoccaceae bacterium]